MNTISIKNSQNTPLPGVKALHNGNDNVSPRRDVVQKPCDRVKVESHEQAAVDSPAILERKVEAACEHVTLKLSSISDFLKLDLDDPKYGNIEILQIISEETYLDFAPGADQAFWAKTERLKELSDMFNGQLKKLKKLVEFQINQITNGFEVLVPVSVTKCKVDVIRPNGHLSFVEGSQCKYIEVKNHLKCARLTVPASVTSLNLGNMYYYVTFDEGSQCKDLHVSFVHYWTTLYVPSSVENLVIGEMHDTVEFKNSSQCKTVSVGRVAKGRILALPESVESVDLGVVEGEVSIRNRSAPVYM